MRFAVVFVGACIMVDGKTCGIGCVIMLFPLLSFLRLVVDSEAVGVVNNYRQISHTAVKKQK